MAEINDHEFIPMVPFMPKKPLYANAYVPYQIDFETYSPKEAMSKGTIFPALYSPYKERGLQW
ncbi:spore coat associated protein CotJA [Alkalibaculum sp. M08DMB]|uniref:Spore coat associated protein CotJA n=1 Tax=Alkalibaculum sporogenes TaxID=2655001 RepID=A0A6A7KCU2_9FIRM|nr:spore coat associated protein CotJA [Alkalibaculum sporogenes]MPW27131.1 spore coat associated protein CotJA [Alkalibaculum sporogenes]